MSPTSSQAERWLAKAGTGSQPSRSVEREPRDLREPGSVMSSRSVRSADPEASFQHASNMMGQTARGFTPPSDDNHRARSYSRYPAGAENEVRDAAARNLRDDIKPCSSNLLHFFHFFPFSKKAN